MIDEGKIIVYLHNLTVREYEEISLSYEKINLKDFLNQEYKYKGKQVKFMTIRGAIGNAYVG